jgi:hypothetical protein
LEARLPAFFAFKTAKDLVRIGKPYDGGYLVSRSDIDASDLLISLGINDDWSFERDFSKIKDIEVNAYDASINQNYFFKQFVKSLIRIDKPQLIFHWLNVLLSYRIFFSKRNKRHFEKFVGLDSKEKIYCTLSSILSYVTQENIFFKIDIEGSEYRLLDTLILNQNRICGLVLELHDCDLHMNAIEKFIKNFDLRLAHIHVNSGSNIRSDGLPLVIELTFSRYSLRLDKALLPHPFDMSNSKFAYDIKLIIENI